MRISQLLCVMAMLLTSLSVQARDEALKLPIADFFQRADVQERLGQDVKFYLAGQKHRAVAQTLGEFQSNKKTSAFKKTDQQACEWALLSAFLALRDRALQLGGNAVVNITSNYKRQPFSSPDQYMCGAGKIMAGVTMKGEVVKLK